MKILCLGNNTTDTDVRTKELADQNGLPCLGLLSDLEVPVTLESIKQDGYYHTSVYDIEFGRLLELSSIFNQVIILDQPREEYTHPDAFYKTIRLARLIPTAVYLDPSYQTQINFFENLVKENPSFCIFPFIELLTSNGNTTVCCRSSTPITRLDSIIDYKTDPQYQNIRTKMINGDLVPEHCSSCYRLEELGILSARQQETVEWANRLDLNNLEDLDKIEYPVYYEVRPSNVCNLQCRMCTPQSSNLIAREYKRIGLISKIEDRVSSDFSFINLKNLKKLYVAGGEPTAMPEFYNFIDACINSQHTDFEFIVNTNAVKINSKFKKQLEQFTDMQFIISIDGHQEINNYIRWPSEWSTIIENVKYLKERGYKIMFNTTVSIYNVSRLFDLLKFFDQEFPKVLVHCQLADSDNDMLSALNFPDLNLALSNLLPIQNLRCYRNDPLLASFVDGLIAHYKQQLSCDLDKLRLFFEFNDRLDQSRSVKLYDYLPELEQARKLL